MINIQKTLETYYPTFFARHRKFALILSRFLGLLFYEKRFLQFEKDYPELEGFAFVDNTLHFFDFSLRVSESERARIPASGRIVIVANHPIGSLDGLALLHLVRQVRPDVKVVANQLLNAIAPLRPLLLPVDNMGGKTRRENLENIRSHLENEGALIIFPAGEVSRLGTRGVKDGEWKTGFLKLANSTQSPILPVHVAGRNSLFFYSLSFLARPISSAWLVREMFKQSHNTVDARIGRPVPHEIYSAGNFKAPQLARMFRKHVYRLARNGKPIFQSVETIAPPENCLLIRNELRQSELLGETGDGMAIYLTDMANSPCVMREIGRLRELSFRAVGEGTGLPRDIDTFDRYYKQLVLWDSEALEIVGAYRLGEADAILDSKGLDGLYTNSLFHYDRSMERTLRCGLELGRSFVQPKYRSRNSLDYLWYGIGAFVKRYPHYRYLYGPVSISRHYGHEAIAQLAKFYGTYYSNDSFAVRARAPFDIDAALPSDYSSNFHGDDEQADEALLKRALKARGLPIPPLYKHYAKVTEPGGVTFKAFNVDHSFSDCVDAFIFVDLDLLTPRKRQRYLGDCADNHAA